MEKPAPLPWELDGETVTFETPEQTEVEYRIAPLGERFAAALLDRLVILGVTVVLFLAVVLAGAAAGESAFFDPDLWVYLVAFGVVFWFLLSLFYFVWGEVRGEGQTWGKRRLGIRTALISGRGLTLGTSLLRNLARVIDELPPLWIVACLTRGKRRLGDLLAGTVVVEARPAAPSPALPARDPGERRFYFSAETASRLYRDDLNLLEHLEARLAAAPREHRERIVREVAREYIERLSLEREEAAILEDPRRFLQEMALFLRERFEGEAY